jgi:hypothetical protein
VQSCSRLLKSLPSHQRNNGRCYDKVRISSLDQLLPERALDEVTLGCGAGLGDLERAVDRMMANDTRL